ncbi:unnamed protein product, partial [Rotaria sp. Silwood2]
NNTNLNKQITTNQQQIQHLEGSNTHLGEEIAIYQQQIQRLEENKTYLTKQTTTQQQQIQRLKQESQGIFISLSFLGTILVLSRLFLTEVAD